MLTERRGAPLAAGAAPELRGICRRRSWRDISGENDAGTGRVFGGSFHRGGLCADQRGGGHRRGAQHFVPLHVVVKLFVPLTDANIRKAMYSASSKPTTPSSTSTSTKAAVSSTPASNKARWLRKATSSAGSNNSHQAASHRIPPQGDDSCRPLLFSPSTTTLVSHLFYTLKV